jgi:CHAD domain-containing protein
MLKERRQVKHFNRQCDSMILHLKSYCEKHDPEDIHKLRLCYKKTKALYKLSSAISASTEPDALKELNDLFKSSAEIRQAGINLKTIAGNVSAEDPYVLQLKKKIHKASSELCSRMETYLKVLENSARALSDASHDIRNKDIKEYFEKELKKLKKFFDASPSPVKLHKKRMKLKNLIFVHAELPGKLAAKIKFNQGFAERLQQNIGDWHDLVIILGEINKLKTKTHIDTNHFQEEKEKKLDTINSLSRKFRKAIQYIS